MGTHFRISSVEFYYLRNLSGASLLPFAMVIVDMVLQASPGRESG
jgi:hypothetical protein